MRRVVRAELDRGEQLRQHPPIIGAVGGADHGVDARMPLAGAGCGLLDQLLKCLFARNREDHLAHDAVGLIERGACDVEEDADLAANLNRISRAVPRRRASRP